MKESQSKNREDHIAGRGMNSLSHCNLVRKFIPMKIPEEKAAVEKKLKNCRKYWHGIRRKSGTKMT